MSPLNAPLDRVGESFSPDLVNRLRELTCRWRKTADIWQAQLDEAAKPPNGAERPPQSSRGGIQNWINWMRHQADDVEAAIGDDTDKSLAPRNPPPPASDVGGLPKKGI